MNTMKAYADSPRRFGLTWARSIPDRSFAADQTQRVRGTFSLSRERRSWLYRLTTLRLNVARAIFRRRRDRLHENPGDLSWILERERLKRWVQGLRPYLAFPLGRSDAPIRPVGDVETYAGTRAASTRVLGPGDVLEMDCVDGAARVSVRIDWIDVEEPVRAQVTAEVDSIEMVRA